MFIYYYHLSFIIIFSNYSEQRELFNNGSCSTPASAWNFELEFELGVDNSSFCLELEYRVSAEFRVCVRGGY